MLNKFLQKRYAMSEKGAKDLTISILWSTLMFFALILPTALAFFFLKQKLPGLIDGSSPKQASFWIYLAAAVGIFIIIWLVSYFQYLASFLSVYKESARTRIKLAETLKQLPLAFFSKKDVADLSATIMEDVNEMESIISHALPTLYGSIFGIVAVSVGMLIFDWKLALATLWVVPPAFLVLFLSVRRQMKHNEAAIRAKLEIADHVQEGLDLAFEIKAYNYNEKYLKQYDKKLKALEKSLIKTDLFTGGIINISQAILKLGVVSVAIIGGILFSLEKVSLFNYIIFLIASASIYNPFLMSLAYSAELVYVGARVSRIRAMQKMPIQTGVKEFYPKNFDIIFDDVSFSYEKDNAIIKNVSFCAKQGEVTALVGPSGGGKSTLAKLSARFWDVDAGKITLDGVDINTIDPETLLKSYSIVFQDVVLFNLSVLENIRIGKKDATDEEVLAAAKLANCDEFVKRLPDGYNSLIGENGERLSGGERQRISIARAILKDAPIILLDEATASLDAESETLIQTAISKLIQGKTVLVIAHRLRTVVGADKVIVVSDGKIIESGNPKDLLNDKNSYFSKMNQR